MQLTTLGFDMTYPKVSTVIDHLRLQSMRFRGALTSI